MVSLEKEGVFFSLKVETYGVQTSSLNARFHFSYLQLVTCPMTLSPKYSSSCQHSQSHRSLQDHNTPSFPASSLRITSTPHRDDFGVAKPPARRDPRAPGAPPVWQPPGRGQRRPSAVLSATPIARWPLCAVSQCPLSLFCLRAARQPAGSPPASLTPGTAPIPASLAPRGGEREVVGRRWARQRCPRLARTRARPVP